MTTVTATELTFVPKGSAKNDGPRKQPSSEPAFDRVEFQAPPDWVRELDSAAEAVGLSRAAYIRLACNKLMAADRRERGGGDT